ncbi:hypothetical protein WN51_09349 [Melipona quadrifasciata]|uniref:Uncharacterized protein n=1 Tax=Melipona quadrifasciata TaxID=166423 RepID=A0A0N0BIG8_9HYME|nr:hypothetical protein WN51_09349 [Melipona quadrifasciata]
MACRPSSGCQCSRREKRERARWAAERSGSSARAAVSGGNSRGSATELGARVASLFTATHDGTIPAPGQPINDSHGETHREGHRKLVQHGNKHEFEEQRGLSEGPRLISRLDGFQREPFRGSLCVLYVIEPIGAYRGATRVVTGRYGQTDKQGRAYETWHLAIRLSDLPAASLRNNP